MPFKNILSFLFVICLLSIPLIGLTGNPDSAWVAANYDKKEVYIKMRDGIRLFTAIYTPKGEGIDYPFLMKRTCYTIRPYGEQNFPNKLGPNKHLMEDKYIFVYQDVRGRYMSEGYYDNMTPHIPNKKTNEDTDESSDTWDTIEWLLKNVKNHNGRVGIWGGSYPGFYTIASSLCNHPALVASNPQCPMTDIWYDDFHHQGAYVMTSTNFNFVFGYQKDKPTTESWYGSGVPFDTPDGYDFYMRLGAAENASTFYKEDNILFHQILDHPNYDEFWQKRRILSHVKDIDHAVMTTGGFYDAEDLYGTLNLYQEIEKQSPKALNTCVYGPWRHGGWIRDTGSCHLGNVWFGDSISDRYQKDVEFVFFNHYLKGPGLKKPAPLPEALIWEGGRDRWRSMSAWPPKEAKKKKLYLRDGGKLAWEGPKQKRSSTSFVSDPAKPVPFTEEITRGMTKEYMTDDQRFASRRQDVLVFSTEALQEPVSLCGEVMARLQVATTGNAADWIVKIIDVYPDSAKPFPHQPTKSMGGYQQMVRSEVFRSRWRNSMEKPEPLKPNTTTAIDLELQDLCHTFLPGHKIMIHIQSSFFPLIDRNPQTYVESIYKAKLKDYKTQTHTVYHQSDAATHLELEIVDFED